MRSPPVPPGDLPGAGRRAKVGVGARPEGGPARDRGVTRTGATDVAEPTPGSDLQQKYRQFLDLMPLTISLAGLPTSETRLYSEDQIEARAITVRLAYKVAKNTARECLGGS